MIPTPRRIALYLSGHGYGHLSQTVPMLLELGRLLPDFEILLRTELPADLLHCALPNLNLKILPGPVDVGVVQRSAIDEDWGATRSAVESFFGPWQERIDAEVARLAPLKPEIVVSNISPLAFPVARRLGIASLALASLDWGVIYRSRWGDVDPWVARIAQAHRDCDLRLSPPLSLPSVDFLDNRSIPLLVRSPHHNRKTVRDALGWGEGEKVALVLFGGTGQPPFELAGLAHIEGWSLALPTQLAPDPLPPNVLRVSIDQPFATPDLLLAADAVVTKPGYGVLSEAWQAGCPVVYLPRRGFPEYPMLHGWLQNHAPSALLDLESFAAGRWGTALALATSCSTRYPPLDPSGGRVAAATVARLMGGFG
ncbi:MAG: hypothetical protein COX57_07795 [Alphaproteobacteria bacterium CG_4_10_14_0_2_um_filter_63_37]|nr:MAG: hypothetical protein AUJ55_03910 [Proteobacteria bacterium CG1_02_64_396]PJA24522.1 MAG: hypothetical protein COX57_07795 [Alphaproteobacteria bacterium CG_4_10_14_0_2_um_filter_63_37]